VRPTGEVTGHRHRQLPAVTRRDGRSTCARDRRGRAVDGTCFVYTKTSEVSLYGFGWDDDDWNGQDRMEFVCASVDSRYRECQLPVDGRARVVKRLSDASCIEGKSYGQRGDRVWVDKGARARFEVTRPAGRWQCRNHTVPLR
jgi:hypothetical protein